RLGRRGLRRERLLAGPLRLADAEAPSFPARGQARGHRGDDLIQDAADVAHQAELERAVPPELRRIAVDQTDARLLRDRRRLAVSEPEVERSEERRGGKE